MTPNFLIFVGLALALLAILAWSMRRSHSPRRAAEPLSLTLNLSACHVIHFPPIRQSLSLADSRFLEQQGSPQLAHRVRVERIRVARQYVSSVHQDFSQLLAVARTLAALSPRVGARQEAKRLWLGVQFECRYQFVRGMLLLGGVPSLQLERMTQTVGTLSARMDAAIAELGERASLAMEMASRGGRGRVNLV